MSNHLFTQIELKLNGEGNSVPHQGWLIHFSDARVRLITLRRIIFQLVQWSRPILNFWKHS